MYCPSQIENPKKTHLDTSGPLCAMEISSPPGSPQVLGLSPPHHGSCTWSIIWFIMISVSQKISRSLDSLNCSWNELYSYKKKRSYQCLLQDLLCLHVVPCLIFCQVLFLFFSLKIGNSLVLRLCVCWLNQKSHQSKISPFSCGFSSNRGSGISAKFPW